MSVLSTGLAKTSAAAGGFSIDNSLRFSQPDSTYLSWTPSSAGNRQKWTFSIWFKRTKFTGGYQGLAYHGTSNLDTGGNWLGAFYNDISYGIYNAESGGGNVSRTSDHYFRDPSAWQHFIIAVDTTQSTASNRLKLYDNGVLASTSTGYSYNYMTQNYNTYTNTANPFFIGKMLTGGGGSQYFDGYIAEVQFVDGSQLTPSDFGEEDTDYKHWKPIAYAGSYGTNGFHLDFKAAGTGTTGAGKDVSGNGNHFTTSGIASTDQMIDTPTNNFCTLNSVASSSGVGTTYTEGNLDARSAINGDSATRGTFGVTTGKWYYEGMVTIGTNNGIGIGFADNEYTGGDVSAQSVSTVLAGAYTALEIKRNGTGYQSNVGSWTTGDVVGVALDMSAGTIQFYKNNSTIGSSESYTGTTALPTTGSAKTASGWNINFGQDSSFAGNKTGSAGPYTDSGSVGDFFYEPPTDFLALCTSNLTAPAVKPQENFGIKLYPGSESTQSITGLGFQPDLCWFKSRSGAYDHNIVDSVRGVSPILYPNSSVAEYASTDGLTSFDTDGFTLGTEMGSLSNGGHTYVAWNWKAGNATLGTGDFTQGTIASTCSRNVDAGFSIVSYTGNVTAGATVGHGLSKAPEMIITKSRAGTTGWLVGHNSLTNWTYSLSLNTTGATWSENPIWNSTAPSATVFTLGSDTFGNSADTRIAYCFHSVDGYSKVGSYTGNYSADGTFVYCGFQPKYVLLKQSSASGNSWGIFDDERSTYNVIDDHLTADGTAIENVAHSAAKLDFVSNGFKARGTGSILNSLSQTYIFIAFAEYPFKYANAR